MRIRLPASFHTLAAKVIATCAFSLLLAVLVISVGSIVYQSHHLREELTLSADRLSNTIRLGARYAMLTNARDEINQITRDVAGQKDIAAIRIYNKEGEIKFSGDFGEVGNRTNIRDSACHGCHVTEPPKTMLSLEERTRIFTGPDGARYLGSLSPIYNEPGCSGPPCHFHPAEKIVLGALDVVLPLERAEGEILAFQRNISLMAGGVFLVGMGLLFVCVNRFLTRPIGALIGGTRRIARGEPLRLEHVNQDDEVGELAHAITRMAREIAERQAESRRQRDEYERLFDQVPCAITVQDRSLRLLKTNREFRERFCPEPGDHCYKAYKGRTEKCPGCSVERTMETGLPHCSEESRVNTDGTRAHWIVHTTPVFDETGQVVAAMEMSVDITARKELEERLRRSEMKYHAIFNHIPNAVFVLHAETLDIMDCNTTAEAVYGWSHNELTGRSFLDLFAAEERERYASQLRAFTVLNRARHYTREGKSFFVDIMLSPAEYLDKQVYLLTTSDITQRLEAEQKVIQAGKMATLGEMATGVAHELNQPLTVIKTASSFLLRKVQREEPIAPNILATMAREIDSHVDRASRIIEHMREFGRKAELALERVDLNAVLRNACEFFSRQLAVRGIEMVWQLNEPLPPVMAVANRLEQVFINLLINARDAIEDRNETDPHAPRTITLRSGTEGNDVFVEIIDSGTGIPRPVLARIFEPFFTTKKVGKGTGLGLSISYGLVKDFGGAIHASNAEGGGARFQVRLPATGGSV